MIMERNNLTTAQNKIKDAAGDAVKIITVAANDAVRTIASAAESAAKLLSSNASEAAKVSNIKNEGDHDLLIRLETKLGGLKDDIRDLKDGTATQMQDHERRLGALEASKTKQNTVMSIGIGLLSLLVGLLLFHLFKI